MSRRMREHSSPTIGRLTGLPAGAGYTFPGMMVAVSPVTSLAGAFGSNDCEQKDGSR